MVQNSRAFLSQKARSKLICTSVDLRGFRVEGLGFVGFRGSGFRV